MTRNRLALASFATVAALSTLALGSPAMAEDESTPPPAVDVEIHGYASVKEITDEVREDFPTAGLLTESIPEDELIRGGPSFDAQGTAIILSE